jgi:hypothetical protein
MAFPAKRDRNRRMFRAWSTERPQPSYRELARRFHLANPATPYGIIQRELKRRKLRRLIESKDVRELRREIRRELKALDRKAA